VLLLGVGEQVGVTVLTSVALLMGPAGAGRPAAPRPRRLQSEMRRQPRWTQPSGVLPRHRRRSPKGGRPPPTEKV